MTCKDCDQLRKDVAGAMKRYCAMGAADMLDPKPEPLKMPDPEDWAFVAPQQPLTESESARVWEALRLLRSGKAKIVVEDK